MKFFSLIFLIPKFVCLSAYDSCMWNGSMFMAKLLNPIYKMSTERVTKNRINKIIPAVSMRGESERCVLFYFFFFFFSFIFAWFCYIAFHIVGWMYIYSFIHNHKIKAIWFMCKKEIHSHSIWSLLSRSISLTVFIDNNSQFFVVVAVASIGCALETAKTGI